MSCSTVPNLMFHGKEYILFVCFKCLSAPVSVLPLPLFSALKNKTTCSPIQHEDKETRQPKQEKQNQTQKTHTQVSQGTLGSFSAAITRGQAGSSTRTHRDVLCNMHTRSKCCFFQEELTSCFRELQIFFFLKDC